MLKVIELFAGVGSQTQALKNIGVEHEVVAIAEFDKHADKTYRALHGEVNNLFDMYFGPETENPMKRGNFKITQDERGIK